MRLLVFWIAICAAAQPAAQQPAALAAAFEAQAKSHVDGGDFIGSVLVAKNGQVLYRKAFGPAQAEWDVPNTPETKFRIGSVTKQFTAVAVMQLAEQGRISLTDPVKKFYSEAPISWDAITVHHLLNHTSGIKSYTGLPDFFAKRSTQPLTPIEIVKLTQDMPLEFEPGTKFAYNNTGYVLLGAVIEKVTGKKYADHMKAAIFDPLEMKDTGFDVSSVVLKNRASGYSGSGKGLVNAAYLHMSLPHAAGSLYSTVDDLLKWDQALYAGKVLPLPVLEKMWTPGLGNYGYGWMITTDDGHRMVAHGGGINGFASQFTRVTDQKIAVVTLSNLSSPGAAALARELTRLAQGLPAKAAFTEVSVAPAKLDEYPGVYTLSPQFSLTVRKSGSTLTIQGSGQAALPAYPYAPDKFFSKAVDAQVEFTRDADGQVEGVILHQNGGHLSAKRQTKALPPERVAVPVAPEKLGDYPGTYEGPGGIAMTIARNAEGLTGQITGQPTFPLFSGGPDIFFFKVVEAELTFHRAGDGKVNSVTLKQAGRETEWKRQ
ncbi:MAG: serine hydrolase [Acidobacteria bacterium]|nr:serine hydrolase [Acidobacteriota bacterium]